jgi:signal transduction histidine kinase/ligand-binding sensor domain-containing protein
VAGTGAASPEASTDAADLLDLRHTAFSPKEGAPSGVMAITQTADGFLWVGTLTGLFRYDGARFDSSVGDRLPSPSVKALLAEPHGGLWIGYSFGGVSYLLDGRVTSFDRGELPRGSVQQFFRAPDGILWVSTSGGLAKLVAGRWLTVGPANGFFGESPDWLGSLGNRFIVLTATAAYLYESQTGRFEQYPRALGQRARYGIPERSGWRPDLSNTAEQAPYQTLLDRSGAVLISGYRSLVRYRWLPQDSAGPVQDRFTTADGLTGDISAIFEDRENNVWVGTDKGLDRFQLPKLMRVGLPPASFHPLLIAGEGEELWVGRTSEPVVRIDGQNSPIPAFGRSVNAATRASDGTVWLAGRDGVFHYGHGQLLDKVPFPLSAREILRAPVEMIPPIQAIAVDRDGGVWLSIATTGLFRWFNGTWEQPGPRFGLPDGPAIRLASDSLGRLWLAYPDDKLAVLDAGRLQLFTAADGLRVGNVLALDVGAQHTWVAGDRGVALLSNGHFKALLGRSGTRFATASGILETPQGELWLNAARGIYRIPKEEVARFAAGQGDTVDFELLDWLDGLDSSAEVIRPGPTLLRTKNGRIWISRVECIWWIDPDHIHRDLVAPIVTVEDVLYNGEAHSPHAAGTLVLPQNTRNIRIDYTAALLTNPERMRFRYRLAGIDEDWQEVGQRRQAYYTNLGPGGYTFEVMAANADGVWSTAAAVLSFNVKPAYYQRAWFKLGMGLLALALIALAFRVRLEQVHRRYRNSMEERHAERERIARDLHDTLLQAVQALLFRLQLWEDDAEFAESHRAEISALVTQARAIVVEGRDRIVMLRRTDAKPADLSEALTAIEQQGSAPEGCRYEVSIEGERRSLTLEAHEQLVDIAREAVRNAYRHARPSHVAVTVEYRRGSLRMSVMDDGRGIDLVALEERGKSRHFGLTGMRERAEQLGATFWVGGNGGGGTRVIVVVPARTAYRDTFTRSRRINSQ